jgi:hypothetical protein
MPLLIGLVPVLGLHFLADRTFERAPSAVTILFAAACVWSGCRVHRRWGLLILLVAGAVLALEIQFGGLPGEKANTDRKEAAVMALGGTLIAASHLLNGKLRACCHCAQRGETRKKPWAPRPKS